MNRRLRGAPSRWHPRGAAGRASRPGGRFVTDPGRLRSEPGARSVALRRPLGNRPGWPGADRRAVHAPLRAG
ncbi:hypothetical protein FRAHR75_780009 [Frankia sp. Hr75.2]|nr:hypothetical protein FRAHR75_780009 [Frankia sp. Hr75.2]